MTDYKMAPGVDQRRFCRNASSRLWLWGLITPQSVHMHVFLEQFLPGFIWLTWWEFLLGLVESFLFGVYAAIVYVPIYNWLTKRFRDAT